MRQRLVTSQHVIGIQDAHDIASVLRSAVDDDLFDVHAALGENRLNRSTYRTRTVVAGGYK